MKESARAAISYIHANADKFGIEEDKFTTKDIHIHVPEGAVPKDGPSAGVTMISALVSELSGVPVRCDIAMTGEITLTGRVLPIGGLPEKSMAAYRNGIRTILIPSDNVSDLEDVDPVIKEKVTFIPVDSVSKVLELALVPNESIKDFDKSGIKIDMPIPESKISVPNEGVYLKRR